MSPDITTSFNTCSVIKNYQDMQATIVHMYFVNILST